MTQHVVLAYGRETEHKRAIFAVLSFWAWYSGNRADVQTLVFTDNPDAFAPYFAGLPVAYEVLTTERLEEMYGQYRYIHRAKAAMLEQVFQQHPNDGVLFCDSDTFFVMDPAQLLRRLQPGTSVMHVREAPYTRAVPKGDASERAQKIQAAVHLIDTQPFKVGAEELQFRKEEFMWNSGVLGLTKETGRLLPDICNLIDTLYADSNWLVAEQVAFSLVLHAKTELLPSNQYVFHYWTQPLKVLMDKMLGDLLSDSFRALPLAERLTQVRHLTTKWPRVTVVGNARKEVLGAFFRGDMVGGMKCAMQAIRSLPAFHALKI